jgi:hypothetical protein
MGLVGSLVFFLLEVFYQGQYQARLTFIMALFVMAAVLIGRISIEEGREYAAMFALPLGIVTLLALFRFVEFHGALANYSAVINIALLAAIWWSADKLTWDCTVLDESKEASSEGLLQTVGLDQDPAADRGEGGPAVDLEATTARDAEAQTQSAAPRSLWQRFVAARRRPHSHGVWVVYFSLAALPIFGFGQRFVSAADLASRRYIFKLLALYVACALGLLLTTSFLGLRRYLRQRRLEMPGDMAATWIGVGATMIVALLLFCLFLPRRNPEYSVTHLPIFAGSRDDLRTSEHAFGHDGPQREDADRAPNRDLDSTTDEQKRSQDGSKQGSGETTQGSPSEHGQSQSRSSQSEQSKNGPSSGGQSKDGQTKGGQSKDGQSQSAQSKNEQSKSGKSGGEKSQSQRSQGDPSQSDPSQNGSSTSEQNSDSSQQQDSARDRREGESDTERSDSNRQDDEREEASQPDDSSRSEQQSRSRGSSSSSSSWNPLRMLPSPGGVLRFLYWIAVIVIVGYLLWRYREQVLRAVQDFLRSLRELWERLFGSGSGSSAAAGMWAPPRRKRRRRPGRRRARSRTSRTRSFQGRPTAGPWTTWCVTASRLSKLGRANTAIRAIPSRHPASSCTP